VDDQNTVTEKVQALLQGLQEESLDVRAVTLGELRNILSSQKQWVSALTDSRRLAEDDSLLRDLISALVKSCSPEITSISSITVQQVCAECLGILGALDPTRVKLSNTDELVQHQEPLGLVQDVLISNLIKLLMTANSMSVLDRVTVAIQDVLKCDDVVCLGKATRRKSRDKTHSLFDTLPQDARAVVKPYLESRYSFGPLEIPNNAFIYTRKMRFRVWLGRWLVKMIHQCKPSPVVSFYHALIPVILFDVPTAMKIAPYVILAYLDAKGLGASRDIVGEILHVIDQNASPSTDGLSCMQSIFSLLDVLNLWNEVQESPVDFDWGVLETMIDDIPRAKLANAAASCGAHARALLYYETHLRLTHGNGSNVSAHSSPKLSDQEVNMLMNVYTKLEEPDGLDGIMKLRQGTAKVEDQRLAAERNGSWTEACSLYELELSHKGTESRELTSDLTDGYLNCLLHMGHWEGLANQVKGLVLSDDIDDLRYYKMASKGAGALWRLGKFEGELNKYSNIPDPVLKQLALDESWELKLSRVLCRINKLRNLSRNDEAETLRDVISKDLSTMRHDIVPHFSAAAKESYGRAYPYLVKLHMIQEVSDVMHAVDLRSQEVIGAKERQRLLKWTERYLITRPTLNTRGPF
jgi:serine/threonine-protein kinase ATR